ncbi:hypothetical protein ACH9EU_18210 [Kocuria sp. M1R5S2]|uniref:arsenate reductase/protein-tyrosine-phosphatase family protein n=1 Tax=Kocuria rhizosphaerae TaxID=3376285 RepID=UPI0037AE7A1D
MPDPRILFVCHGNVARSPAAELLARARFGGLGWEFGSCGIGALVGEGVTETVAAELRGRGVDPSPHRARQAERGLLQDATLVLTMERYQRAWILDEWPDLAGRTLVLGQAVRLREQAARRVDPLAHLELHQGRAVADDDVADPFRRGPAAARTAVAEIERALDRLLPWLGPARA